MKPPAVRDQSEDQVVMARVRRFEFIGEELAAAARMRETILIYRLQQLIGRREYDMP